MNRYLLYKRITLIFFINFYTIHFCSNIYSHKKENILDYRSDINCQTDNCKFTNKTLFLPLSAAQNLYTQYHKNSIQTADISVTYRFQQSYNNNDIARSLFVENPLIFVGEKATPDNIRPLEALVPEYFGLAGDTNTSLYLAPRIRNQIIDLQISFQGNNFWIQTNIPLVKAQWNINTLPMSNNKSVGIDPLQPEAQTYIYNINQKYGNLPGTPPPNGTPTDAEKYNYNILPIIDPAIIGYTNTGSYIVSSQDASQNDSYTGKSFFTEADENTGSINFSEEIYNQQFIGNSQLNGNNWKLDIGQWPNVEYDSLNYNAATTPVPPQTKTNPATLNPLGNFVIQGSIENVQSLDGQEGNTLQITQNQLNSATSLEDALSGNFNFNQTLKRLYNNFNFNTDICSETWGIGDIILWLGYDFCQNKKYNIGIYLHGVVPTGTNINQEWYYYSLNPVIGNGHHYQMGVGISGQYLFCDKQNYSIHCNINGYIDHVFSTKQFRVFDKNNNPMSRYAIVKALQYTGASSDNFFNDDYEFKNLNILGNLNNIETMISNNLKSEFIIDFVIKNSCSQWGIGYAFSGLTGDQLNCNLIPNNTSIAPNIANQTYYGYKGNTAISNLIITNINSGQEIFDPRAAAPNNPFSPCPNNPAQFCNYPLCAIFPAFTPIVGLNYATGTPQPNQMYIKSSGDVTIGGNSGAFSYGTSSGEGDTDGTDYLGTTADDIFILPDINNNNSGIINGQIINKIFAHIEHSWDSLYAPKIGIIGSYGFGSQKYFTALYWDVGCYIGCSF